MYTTVKQMGVGERGRERGREGKGEERKKEKENWFSLLLKQNYEILSTNQIDKN
jgi:hypothetical protein